MNISNDELYMMGDYNRLKQVFINVIKNAIEAIPSDREGKITLSSKTTKKDIIICVKDNGIGIDADILDKIDEAFYTTKEKGTGLGLALSKEIINGHQGTVEYESNKDIGTNVKIRLPLNYEK